MFNELKKPKQIKKIMKQLGMEKYDFNGYMQDYDILYMSKKLGDGNYLLASYRLAEFNKVVMPSYGTRIDLIDTFMATYLENGDINSILDNIIDVYKPAYKFEVPTEISKLKSVKDMNKDYKFIYTRDNNAIEKSLIKTIDLYYATNDDESPYVSFKSLHFIASPDFTKTGKGNKYIELEGNTIVVPKAILNTSKSI